MYHLKVLSPVATTQGELEPLDPAPRRATLDGQTVGLIWNAKRGGEDALARIAALLELQGIGTRTFKGAFPCPDSLLAEAKESCDAFVISVGDCGASAAWTAHDVFRLEQAGKPAVGLISAGYEEDARVMARGKGIKYDPFVRLPRVLSTLPVKEIHDIAESALGAVVSLLTREPQDQPEVEDNQSSLTYQDEDPLEAWGAFNRSFLQNRWGDGMPLVPPTNEKVEQMLGGWLARADELVAVVPPGNGRGTYKKAATNAVMAGCSPEHFPVVVAALDAYCAMGEPAVRMAVSAAPLAPLLVVNGPIIGRLSLNFGRCALGPGRESAANIAIGRAFRLCMMNLGLCYPGQLDTDTIGTPKKFSMCLAENEEANPWEPLHAEKGKDPKTSTVTLFCVGSESLGTDLWNSSAQTVLQGLANEESRPGGWYLVQAFGGEKLSEHGVLVLMSPEHAALMANEGWTKYQVKQFLWHEASMSARRLMNKWWSLRDKVRSQWKWLLDLTRSELEDVQLPALETPDHFEVVVVGGESPFDSLYGIFGSPVTVPIPEP